MRSNAFIDVWRDLNVDLPSIYFLADYRLDHAPVLRSSSLKYVQRCTSRARQRGTSNRVIEWSIVSCIVFKISRALSVSDSFIPVVWTTSFGKLRGIEDRRARARMCAAWDKRCIHNSLLGLYITRSRIYTHFTHIMYTSACNNVGPRIPHMSDTAILFQSTV